MTNKGYDPLDNTEEFDNFVEIMIGELLEIINTKPSPVAHSAILSILVSAYKLNGHKKKNLIQEISDAWDFYEKNENEEI